MKFSIGLRLFVTVLLSITTVAIVALLLMQEKVSSSFADYAIKIELARLQEVSDAIEEQYAKQKDWGFLPTSETEKKNWVSEELIRLRNDKIKIKPSVEPVAALSQKSHVVAPNTKTAAPVPPVPPMVSEVEQSQIQTASTPKIQRTVSKIIYSGDEIGLPPLPPPPPAPPAPPPIEKRIPQDIAERAPQAVGLTNKIVVIPDLFSRISILDKNENYLAGLPLSDQASAVRPLHFEKELIGYIQVVKSRRPSDNMARDFVQDQSDTIALIIIASILLSAIAASILALHFRRPIQKLVDGSQQLADGRFETRLPENRSDELGELARSFNQLAIKLAHAEQSRRQWVADTSHELRTPISVLRAQLEAIQDGIRAATPDNISLMLRQVLSLNKLIDELYALAKSDVGELAYHMGRVDVLALVQEECANFKEKLQTARLRLEIKNDIQASNTDNLVQGDVDRLRQVIINLLENAIRYTQADGQIRLQIRLQLSAMTHQSHGRTQAKLIIDIEDSAPGVPDQALKRLSERFYRVDASRNRQQGGAGLGLALCARIIEAHQGKLTFSHSNLGGLHVRIELPKEPIST
ncbi:MAG: HAMP domain-containing protein [Undibacterium sp.]|nr:HAMP domain-containing protein [Undibacterium sp.]